MIAITLAVLVVTLLLVAVVYDLVARRRGTYRSPSEWNDISRRRKAHFQRQREARRTARRDGADGPGRG